MILPYRYYSLGKQFVGRDKALVLLLPENEKLGETPAQNTYIVNTPQLGNEFWISARSEDLGQSIIKSSSLMTNDLDTVISVIPCDSTLMGINYLTLKELKKVNDKVLVTAALELNPEEKPERKLNSLTFASALIKESLASNIILFNHARLRRYFEADVAMEQMNWCAKKLFGLVKDYVAQMGVGWESTRLLQLTCFKTNIEEIFKDLPGFARFAKFVNWGTYFSSKSAAAYVEGPARLVDKDEIKRLVRREGWLKHSVKTAEVEEHLGIVILEEESSFLLNLKDECKAFVRTEPQRFGTIRDYVILLRLLSSFEDYLHKVGGLA